LAHELVVIGDVAGGSSQCLDSGSLGHIDPNLGNQNTLEIEAGNFHVNFLQSFPFSRRSPRSAFSFRPTPARADGN
jgi:hypothetical protein